MMPQQKYLLHPDPLRPFTLDAVLSDAAQLRPAALALRDADGRSLTFAALAREVDNLAAYLPLIGLQPGETIVLIGGPQCGLVTGLLACAKAGLHVALAPVALPATQLAQIAVRLAAAAIISCDPHDGFMPQETAFASAALAGCIRLVATLGTVDDGAVDLSPQTLAMHPQPGSVPEPQAPGRIITLQRDGNSYLPVSHDQRTLVAGTMDLLARTRITHATPLLSTIAPLTYAGLAAGPLAMLLAGTSLDMHGPFDSTRFLKQISTCHQPRLVVPAAMLSALESSGLMRGEMLGGILALSRWQVDAADFSPPQAVSSTIAVADLHAFGECALVAEPRGADGRARAILDPPHSIDIGGILMLATGASADGNDALGFFGAAVTRDSLP